MAYENLKTAIKQVIKQNGNQEITGSTMQSTLLSMVDNIPEVVQESGSAENKVMSQKAASDFLYNELIVKYTQCDTITDNLIIDTHNRTITIQKGYIISIKQAPPINEQTVSYDYNGKHMLYIVYLNKNAELKCVNYDYFIKDNNEIKNIQLILCRFVISKGNFRLSNAYCNVIIDNTVYSIDSNSRELATIKKNEAYYIHGYNFIKPDKIETWTDLFKVTKPIKVSKNLAISNACSASTSANACILYDEAFNIIGTIKGNRAEESIAGTLYVDITYNDIKNATYIQICEDERNPAKYSNAEFVAPELWNNRLSRRVNEDDYFVQSPGNSDQTISYSNILVMKYDAFEKEIYAVRVNFGMANTDIDIIVLNSVTKSYKKIQTIKKEFINSNNEYQTFFLKDPLYMKANMYIGFSKGVRWRVNTANTIGGSWILSDDSTEWQNQKTVIFEYGIYARNVSKNFIGKTFSVMTDSLGTDDYATSPRRVYWRRLQEIASMTNYTNSIKGGTCIMPGLRYNSSIPFVDENRYAALKENGRTGKDPDIIIIQGGINDFGTTPSDGVVFEKFAEIGTKDDIGKSAETSFYAAYSFLLQKLTETYPNAQLICCTPIKMWAFEGRLKTYYPLTNIHGLKLQDFVDAIKYISGVYGAKVADLYGNFPANEKSWQNYQVDHYHPNDAGYAIITEILLNTILNK